MSARTRSAAGPATLGKNPSRASRHWSVRRACELPLMLSERRRQQHHPVEQHESGGQARPLQCHLQRDRHAVAAQHRVAQAGLLADAYHVVGQDVEAVTLLGDRALAVAAQVDVQDPMSARQVADLCLVVRAIPEQAVQEHDRGVPVPGVVVGDVKGLLCQHVVVLLPVISFHAATVGSARTVAIGWNAQFRGCPPWVFLCTTAAVRPSRASARRQWLRHGMRRPAC
jgi:hypothetical protein